MSVETATYINQLDATLPGINDPKSEGDDHLRLIKGAVKATFPNLTATPVTPTSADLNTVAGASSTGAVGFNVQTQASTDNTTKAASTAMVQAAILASSGITASLPAQSGNAGKFLSTNGTSPVWASAGLIGYSARTSNTQITVNDKGNLIDITSGTFTQTFDACSSLGAGWYAYIRNSGTGDITLDPNGSETIDGLTSYVMYPGEARLVQCDGTGFNSVVLNPFYRTFTASGTFTKPPGYNLFAGYLWGAGGGGGKLNDSSYYCGGGGGGACVAFTLPSSSFGASETITIGAGGTGPTANNTAGGVGGNSTVGSLVTSYGGGGGGLANPGATNSAYGGGGGGWSSAGGTGNTSGSSGVPGLPYVVVNSINYGGVGFGGGTGGNGNTYEKDSTWGGGGGGSSNNANGGSSLYGGGGGGSNFPTSGGTSKYGGSGGSGATTTSGVDGSAPGGGGGATQTGTKAGTGARGELRIWGVI